MAHITMNQYLQQFESAVESARGNAVAELLSHSHAHVANPRLLVEDSEMVVCRVIDPPWNEIVIHHLKCLASVHENDFDEAYKHQSALVLAFNKIFQSMKDENWALPILYAVCLDLRLLAGRADSQMWKKSKSKPCEKLEKAADVLMGCFRVCANDSRCAQEDSKRWGMLNLVNQLFKIYFKINKLHLCKPLIRAMDNTNLKDQFSIAQKVTYRYYVGRKAMFEGDFKNAADYLMFAFEKCHKDSKRNKRLILIYLIPVKMLLGQMPSTELLEKYDLNQFVAIKKAVIEGNLLELNEALTQYEAFFIKCGVYLILEKLKIITYRNLFKRVHLLLKTHQVPMEAFLVALKQMQVEDIDLDETHCLVANLIYEGKIKGYISLQHQKLVVSKQNAFPPLSSVC